MSSVPVPFVAYLRVYEPLSAFEGAARDRIAAQLERGAIEPVGAGVREQGAWLRTQVSAPPRLLPGESVDGSPLDTADVLVLDDADVPSGPSATVGPQPLVCPLDLRGRCAAALVGFLDGADVPLRSAVLGVPVEKARVRASAVVAELASAAVHVLSSTWTIPLPWFVLVDPARRRMVNEDCRRRVWWTAAMADARRRVARAHAVSRGALGDEGPTKILRETGRWLEQFHPHSAVELDYGGLVQMLSANDLLDDTSATDVHAIVDAMEAGDTEEVAELYERLRDFWSEIAAHERYN